MHVEHGTSSNDEKEDSIVSSDSDNSSIYLSENDSKSETIDLKEFKDDSKFAEKTCFLPYRVYSVQSKLKDSNDQTTFKQKIDEGWNKMPKMKKQEFIRQTPVNNKEQIFCICRKTYNIGKESSAMVGFELCNEWYHNNCIDFEPSFTRAVPLFICHHCID